MTSSQALVHRIRPSAELASSAVDDTREQAGTGALVLLHGRGSDENDLFSVLDFLDPQRQLTGVTVGGPLSLPPGGRHWYALARVGYPDPPTFHATLAQLGSFLAELTHSIGVPWERTVVGGFSQGAVMSYALALGVGRPRPAGVLAMSGFLPTVEGFQLDLDGRRGLPVAITHGTLDPVIPVDLGRAARDRLQDAGLAVSYHESAMRHTIDPRLVPEFQRWLADTTAASARVGG